MLEINSKMKGPFNLVGDENLFKSIEADSSGIYFFTISVENRYLIEYVGITTRSFKKRFLEHIRELLSGGYQLYDFKRLLEHKTFVVWKGRYGKGSDDISVFLDNYLYFSKIIENQIKEFKIFLIPLNEDRRILERIEGGIYQILKEKNDKRIMTFIKGVRSSPKRNDEELINFTLTSNALSSEIPDSFKI